MYESVGGRISMYESIGGDKVLLSFDNECAFSPIHIQTKNSPFSDLQGEI
jgi:hypothetical protein